MRMIKDQEEIELICQSIHTTKRAIYNVMNHAKEHDMETMAEAYHNFILTKENKQISFESIIASGKMLQFCTMLTIILKLKKIVYY